MRSKRIERLENLRAGLRRVEEAQAARLRRDRDQLDALAGAAHARAREALVVSPDATASWLSCRHAFSNAETERARHLESARDVLETDLVAQRERVRTAYREEERMGKLRERLREVESARESRLEELSSEEIALREATRPGRERQ